MRSNFEVDLDDFNPRQHRLFCFLRRHRGGGGVGASPLAFGPNSVRASRKKNIVPICRDETKPMVPGFKVIDQMVTSEGRSITQKSRKAGPDRTTSSVSALFFFYGALITNIMLVLIAYDVFMHLGQVGSGQVRSTGRGPAGYS